MEIGTDYVAIATALGTAIYAALGLDYVATAEFGLSLQAVCNFAVIVALMIGIFLAIEFLGDKIKNIE